MSKYNNGSSIPVNELSNEEREKAMKEWAEGDENLEKLLHICFEKGIETVGCHVGPKSYIQFCRNDENYDFINMLNRAFKSKCSSIQANPDGALIPFSGQNWYEPSITIDFNAKNKNDTTNFFADLNDSLLSFENQDKISILNSFLDLCDFFEYKNSCLDFVLYHTEDDKYKFLVGLYRRPKAFDYCNKLFETAGLQREDVSEDCPVNQWYLLSDDLEEFNDSLNKATNCIIENFSLEAPDLEELSSSNNFIALVRYARFKSKNSIVEEQKFNEWLELKKEEYDKRPVENKQINKIREELYEIMK